MIDYKIIAFKDSGKWRQWMEKNHNSTDGVWLRMYKKDSGVKSIKYAEALDVALCYGWIDGQSKKYDELSYIQKFTPRRKRSIWSKQNREHVNRLTKAKLMAYAGIKEVERAKEDGRWDLAYDKASTMTIPEYFLKELRKKPTAKIFFETLNKTNLFAIGFRLQTAKTEETRKRRMDKILDMLEKQEKFH